MPPTTAATPQPHMGRKIEKIRTLKGIKQEALAQQLGITQSMLSRIERSPDVDEDRLKQIAEALEMSVEALKNFNEETVINNIQNNYEGSIGSTHQGYLGHWHDNTTQINPLEKYVEMVEENKRLYQALLEEKDSKIKMLEEMMKGKAH